METAENPVFCKSPMFLRTLGAAKKSNGPRENKVRIDHVVAKSPVTISNNPVAECKEAGIQVYNKISRYHQTMSLNRAIPDNKAFSFGLELEAVTKTYRDSFNCKYRDLLQSNWIFGARDGSLPDNMSVELATIPLPSDYALDFTVWRDLTNHLRKFLYSHPSSACGLHTHIGTQYLLPSHPLYDKSAWTEALNSFIKLAGSNNQNSNIQGRAKVMVSDLAGILRSICDTNAYVSRSPSHTTDPLPVPLYNLLVHRTNGVSLVSLYLQFSHEALLSHLPHIKIDNASLQNYTTARCATVGSFLLRDGVSYAAAAQPSVDGQTSDNISTRRALINADEALSYDQRILRSLGATTVMNERSAAKGTRANIMRAHISPDSTDGWNEAPFIHVLFGRAPTHYCGEVEFADETNQEIYYLTKTYPASKPYLHMKPLEFAAFLSEETGVQATVDNIVRALNFLLPVNRSSAGSVRCYWNLNDGNGVSPFDSVGFTWNRGTVANKTRRVMLHLHNYLKHYWPDPTRLKSALDEMVLQAQGLATSEAFTVENVLIVYSLFYKLLAAPDLALDSCSHHNEICTTRSTVEFRRGKGTLNPHRIHAILTFLYYLSTTAAAQPVTPTTAKEAFPGLCRALYEQGHSPLLSHLALSCLPPAYTGATKEEALYRSAPAVMHVRNEE